MGEHRNHLGEILLIAAVGANSEACGPLHLQQLHSPNINPAIVSPIDPTQIRTPDLLFIRPQWVEDYKAREGTVDLQFQRTANNAEVRGFYITSLELRSTIDSYNEDPDILKETEIINGYRSFAHNAGVINDWITQMANVGRSYQDLIAFYDAQLALLDQGSNTTEKEALVTLCRTKIVELQAKLDNLRIVTKEQLRTINQAFELIPSSLKKIIPYPIKPNVLPAQHFPVDLDSLPPKLIAKVAGYSEIADRDLVNYLLAA